MDFWKWLRNALRGEIQSESLIRESADMSHNFANSEVNKDMAPMTESIADTEMEETTSPIPRKPRSAVESHGSSNSHRSGWSRKILDKLGIDSAGESYSSSMDRLPDAQSTAPVPKQSQSTHSEQEKVDSSPLKKKTMESLQERLKLRPIDPTGLSKTQYKAAILKERKRVSNLKSYIKLKNNPQKLAEKYKNHAEHQKKLSQDPDRASDIKGKQKVYQARYKDRRREKMKKDPELLSSARSKNREHNARYLERINSDAKLVAERRERRRLLEMERRRRLKEDDPDAYLAMLDRARESQRKAN